MLKTAIEGLNICSWMAIITFNKFYIIDDERVEGLNKERYDLRVVSPKPALIRRKFNFAWMLEIVYNKPHLVDEQ